MKQKDNNYKLYKDIRPIEEYYSTWSEENLKGLTINLANAIYQKYLVKCKVFQRDNFKCQNNKCKYPTSQLTYHHIKWKKNGGEDKVRNGVTLCRSCHMAFHKAKKSITFFNSDSLPIHIRGHTFKLKIEEKLDWKKIRAEMRVLRKNLKSEHGITISPSHWLILMKFITTPYYEWDD